MVIYVARRILAGRREGKRWDRILADGAKTKSGSVWIDAFLFTLIMAAIAGLLFLAIWIDWG